MAKIKAAQSGNWTSTSTWSGGVVPGVGDHAYSNTFTVVIDTNISVEALHNAADAAITASAGGKFQVASSGITVTLNAGIQSSDIGASGGLLQFTHSSGTSSVIATNNSIVPNPGSSFYAIINTSSGTANVTGNIAGGASGNTFGCVLNTSSGTLNITGTVSGGGTLNCPGVINNSTGNVVVNGNVIGGSSGGIGVDNQNAGSVVVNGNVQGGAGSNSYGIRANSSGPVTINGNLTGGSASTGYGALVSLSTGRLAVTGDVNATASTGAINNPNGGAVKVGVSGAASTVLNIGAVRAINGLWMVVGGADIQFVVPTDAAFPSYTGTTTTLSVKGTTTGDGLLLLSDIADVVGAQLEASKL